MLTKKHFKNIAKILNLHKNQIDPNTYESIVKLFTSFCYDQNSRFNRSKFKNACNE